ncbi:MAG: hypothetical protein HC888_07400 [Candidatus Competibacteraceae bacterium]|nr:hypothetical protein [Candidatus Competibacteraceae bacterium]
MLYLDMTFEDLRIIAENKTASQSGPWHVRLTDLPSGREETRDWSDTQLSCVLLLVIGGDKHLLAEAALPIAEAAVENLASLLRPIP